MCKCISSNIPKNGQVENEVILTVPEWMKSVVKRDTVCVDSCISDIIQGLWRRDIVTLNSCCGHNESNPSIIIHHSDDPVYVLSVLKTLDNTRDFMVGRWNLKTNKLIFYVECLKPIKARCSSDQMIKFVNVE